MIQTLVSIHLFFRFSPCFIKGGRNAVVQQTKLSITGIYLLRAPTFYKFKNIFPNQNIYTLKHPLYSFQDSNVAINEKLSWVI